MDLNDLIEGDNLFGMVSDCHDKTLSVALVEENLDIVPATEELKKFFE